MTVQDAGQNILWIAETEYLYSLISKTYFELEYI